MEGKGPAGINLVTQHQQLTDRNGDLAGQVDPQHLGGNQLGAFDAVVDVQVAAIGQPRVGMVGHERPDRLAALDWVGFQHPHIEVAGSGGGHSAFRERRAGPVNGEPADGDVAALAEGKHSGTAAHHQLDAWPIEGQAVPPGQG